MLNSISYISIHGFHMLTYHDYQQISTLFGIFIITLFTTLAILIDGTEKVFFRLLKWHRQIYTFCQAKDEIHS